MASLLHLAGRWLLTSLTALACIAGGNRLVLCLEPDGHVTLEFAADDCGQCCGSASARSGSPVPPDLESCPCEDVALSVPDLSSVKRVTSGEPPAPLALAALQPAWTELAVSALRPRQACLPRSHASLALPFLRSVVLLV